MLTVPSDRPPSHPDGEHKAGFPHQKPSPWGCVLPGNGCVVREKGNTKNLCWMSAIPRGQLQERLELAPGLSPQSQGMGEVLGGPLPDRGWTGGLSFGKTRSGQSSPCNCQGAWKGSKEAWAGRGGAKEVARAALASRPLECWRGEAGTPCPRPGRDPAGGAGGGWVFPSGSLEASYLGRPLGGSPV